MEIAFTTRVRPDTGFTNGKLGMWLFLASEVMFFGGLFSAYAFLRTAAESWPPVDLPHGVVFAGAMTGVLVAAHACVYGAAAVQKTSAVVVVRLLLCTSMALSAVFLGMLMMQYRGLVRADLLPRTNTYVALYFMLTGLHGLHVFGAVLVELWFVIIASAQGATDRIRFEGRLEILAMFWLLLVVLWLVKFILFYVV